MPRLRSKKVIKDQPTISSFFNVQHSSKRQKIEGNTDRNLSFIERIHRSPLKKETEKIVDSETSFFSPKKSALLERKMFQDFEKTKHMSPSKMAIPSPIKNQGSMNLPGLIKGERKRETAECSLKPEQGYPFEKFVGSPAMNRVKRKLLADTVEEPIQTKSASHSSISNLHDKLNQEIIAHKPVEQSKAKSISKKPSEFPSNLGKKGPTLVNNPSGSPVKERITENTGVEEYDLVVPPPPPPELKLPVKYQTLSNHFNASDHFVALKHKETVTFNKLKTCVQQMTRRTFNMDHLGQFKTVYPFAYKFEQKKLPLKKAFELCIEPIIPKRKDGIVLSQLNAVLLLARKTIFNDSLLQKVILTHAEFLKELDPDLEIPKDRLKRWHPSFLLEMVPDIFVSELPKPPDQMEVTATKIISDHKEIMNPKIQAVLEKLRNNPDAVKKKLTKTKLNEIKGISSDLLNQVRQKEAVRTAEILVRSEDDQKELGLLQKLPDVASIIRNQFIIARKHALPRETICAKLHESLSMSLANVNEHVELILKVVPDWLKTVKIRTVVYLKNDPNVTSNQIKTAINGYRERL